MNEKRPYCGRFAPSPTGPLHQGSLVSALASYLDARAHGGRWLLRIEDVDGPRAVPGAADDIIETLACYGMCADAPPVWQSTRFDAYQSAFDALETAGYVYPCACTRREIADSLIDAHARHTTLAYPGTCRCGLNGRAPRAWRLRVPGPALGPASGDAPGAQLSSVNSPVHALGPVCALDALPSIVHFHDRWQGAQSQDLATEVGDFALKRADGLWAYQLAVVVDDAAFGITDVVRGADLLDSTARQIYLQRCLGVPTPRYLHVPVLLDGNGEKLSKQTGARPLERTREACLRSLTQAAAFLGLHVVAKTRTQFYDDAIAAWTARLGT